MSTATRIKRPVLRWYGGKWKLAPWIIGHFPPHRVYTEAFGGAGFVLLRKPRSYAEVYNDLDGDVVNYFRVLRDPATAAALGNALRNTPFAREEFKAAYERTDDPVERARRLVVRSYMGFGSNAGTVRNNTQGFRNSTLRKGKTKDLKQTGFRASSNLSGTTPAHDWANYPACIASFVERLQAVVVENKPALEILQRFDGPDTLHYLDPPYVLSTRVNRHKDSYAFEMTDEDQEDLANAAKGLRGMVILSGYESDLYCELYKGWNVIRGTAFAHGAKKTTEVLWFNDAAWANMPAPRML